jgi:uncharacterized protein DUF6174
VLVACGDSPVSAQAQATLNWARARWESTGIDSYEITVRRGCFCYPSVGAVRLTVKNGEVVSRVIVATGDTLSAQSASVYPDVPGLFAIIDHALANADAVDPLFDEIYGFPTRIWIDWKVNWADDETAYWTEGFSPRQ